MNKIYAEIITEMYNLKNTKRAGWILKDKNINPEKVESVSDHSWGASLLALLFLPNDILEFQKVYCNEIIDGYNKDKIIAMLLLHDIAEAYIGDIPFGEKSVQDKLNEANRIEYYASLSKLEYLEKFENISLLWTEYSKRQSINAKIAKDFDQLEGFIQLYMYKDLLIAQNGQNKWKKMVADWRSNIQLYSECGKHLETFVINNLFGQD